MTWEHETTIETTYLHEVGVTHDRHLRTWAFEADLTIEVGYSVHRSAIDEWEILRIGADRLEPYTSTNKRAVLWFDPADPVVAAIRDRLHKSDDFRTRVQEAHDELCAYLDGDDADYRRGMREVA